MPREQGGQGGLGREEDTRTQTAQPLSYIPCPAGVKEKHIQCVLGWENGLKKIISYEASKISEILKTQQKFPSLKYLAMAAGLAWLPLAPVFLLLWPGLAPTCGSSLTPTAPSREG